MTESERKTGELFCSYLQYLPSFYRENDFAGRFLRIFEDILKPIEGVVDNLAFYFDPGMAPSSILPWLAAWVGLVLDERWPEARRRKLIASAAELYRWRGTRRGISQFLEIYTGVTPQIIESTPASTPSTSETKRAGEEIKPNCFAVILKVPGPAEIDPDIVRAIIEVQKPAHAAYILKIVQ